MEIKQKLELRKLLAPELRQSLQILALPIMDLKELLEQEMQDNPVLEEAPSESIDKMLDALSSSANNTASLLPISKSNEEDNKKQEYAQAAMTQKMSLQDMLLKQLGIFADSEDDIVIGREIIGNIDDNGYLRTGLDEIASSLNISTQKAEKP